MPTWKKLVVSGSNISQLVNDVNYVINGQAASSLSGSFSGSFYGDGSNIINVTATSINYDNITNKPTLVSGSSQIDITAVDGYSTFSQSIDSHLDANISAVNTSITNLSASVDAHLDANITAISSSAHTQRVALDSAQSTSLSNVSASFAVTQGVQDGRLSSLESFTASLDATYATDSELNSATASLKTYTTNAVNTLSASVDAHLDANISVVNTSITNLSGSAHSQRVALISALSSSVDAHLDANISALSSSAHTANNNLSASFASSLSGLSQTLSVSGSSGNADVDLKSQDLSIVGNGAGITTSVSGTTVTIDANGLVSGSSQVTLSSTTGYSAFSSSIDSHLDANISAVNTSISNLSGSAHTQRTALINALSSSVDSHLDANISAVNSSISSLSGSAHSQRVALINALSSSVDTHLDANISALNTSITNLSSSVDAHLDANVSVLNTSITNLSGSAHTQRVALDNAQTSNLSSVSASFATTIANTTSDVTNLNASQSLFDAAFNLSGTDVTVNGNFTVAGTTTYVNSTQIELGDNILELNGTGSSFAGLKVNDNNGPASGSLLWDGINNYWIAGGEGSEVKILLAEGDNVVSGSSQITISSTTGYTAFSQSIDSHLDANVSALTTAINNLSASADAHLDANVSVLNTSISNLSGSAHSQRVALINALSSSVDSHLDANISAVNTSISNLSGSAHSQREALISALSSSVDTHLDANISAVNTSISNLSGSAHTQRTALYNALSTSITNLSSSVDAHLDANISALSASAATANNNLSSALTSAYQSADTALSSSFATTISGLSQTLSISGSTGNDDLDLKTEDLTFAGAGGLSVNVAGGTVTVTTAGSGIVSGSSQLSGDIDVTNVNATSITGSVISGSFVGDGSGLFNITVDQASTISSTFTNVTTKTVDHNFATRNISVVVYDSSYNQIIPASVNLNTLNQATITFCEASTGTVVVMKGGHIVSGSIPAANIDGLSDAINTYLDLDGVVSSSVQIDITSTTGYSTFSSSIDSHLDASISALSSSVDTHLDANISALSASVDAHLDANISALSSSAHTQREALISALSSSVDTHLDANISAVNTSISNLSSSAATANINLSTALTSAYQTADSNLSSSFASTIANLSSTLRISGSTGNDSVNLVNDSLSVVGTAGEIETAVTDNQIQIGIVTNPTLTGNVTVTGNLTIQGDTIQAQVSNLNVEDRFILLNSGSNAGDSGIIFGGSDGTANEGSGIFWDSPSNVFGFASGISSTDVTSTHVAKLGYIQQNATAAPTTAPSFQGVGAIHIKEDTGCIYIYA